MGQFLCGHRLRVSRIPQDPRRPSLSRGGCPEDLLPSAAGSGTDTGAGGWVGVEDTQVVLKQFEPEGELVAGGFVGEGDGDKPVVRCGIWAELGADAAVGAVGRA